MKDTANNLLTLVSPLLKEHDCVIIPGLGAFVAASKSAAIRASENTIAPAYKHISFNSRVQHNDSLLTNAFAAHRNIGYSQAAIELEEGISFLKKQLESGNTISISGIGKLQLTTENNLLFVPAVSENLLLGSFGLKPVSLPEKILKTDTAAVETLIANSIPSEEKTEVKKRGNRWALYGLVPIIAALVFVSQILFMNAKEEQLPLQLALTDGFEILFKKENVVAKHPVIIEKHFKAPALSIEIAAPRLDDLHVTTVSATSAPKGYYAVLGSFKEEKNARKAQKQFQRKNIETKVIQSGEFYRIGIFMSDKISDAHQKLDAVKESVNKQAWMLANV